MKLNSNFCILHFSFCIILLLAGCARLHPGMKPEVPAETPRGLEIHTQYAVSSDPKLGYDTFEVYVANHTDKTVMFTGVELNGKPMPKVQSKEFSKLATVRMGDGDEIPLIEPGFPEDCPVTWWQYYPRNEAKPGETLEFQVNFKAKPTGRQELRLLRHGGEPICVVVPRFRQPEKRLTAITYSLDGKRIFVQYASRKVDLKRLMVNGHVISGVKIMRSVEGNAPDLAALDAPFDLKTGDVLHVRAEFEDGFRREALVRVLLGIALDGGFSGGNNEQAIRKEYGLDDFSVVEMLPFDVACGDTKAGKQGMSAPTVTETRKERYLKEPYKLGGINYCAASCPATWNIYGQISDAVYAKPYQLNWGKQPPRFIEAEERVAEIEAGSARPRPWLWVPDRYNRSGRYMAFGELKVLSWLMLARGSKGIRYHYWNKPVAEISAEHPWLLTSLAGLNGAIASHKEVLAPLVAVGKRIQEKVEVYESWSGDRGLLILVRNLEYRTEASESKGQEPRFTVKAKQALQIFVDLPGWVKGRQGRDLLSGAPVPVEAENGRLRVELDRLEGIRLIWVEN